MREVNVERKTKETDISVKLNLDGNGNTNIDTGVGFFDHMLTALSVHSGIDIDLRCAGDLKVDCHHTVEDCGIVLGKALGEALGDKSGIVRYGEATIPMDESLVDAVVDISGRPFLVFNCPFMFEKMGDMDTQMCEEFFRAFTYNSNITLHINLKYGANDHHKAEACFKAVAHALKFAIKRTDNSVLLSTKGSL